MAQLAALLTHVPLKLHNITVFGLLKYCTSCKTIALKFVPVCDLSNLSELPTAPTCNYTSLQETFAPFVCTLIDTVSAVG